MDKIIKAVKKSDKGYNMTNREIKIVWYTDDVKIISEIDFQRLLNSYFQIVRKYNMQVSVAKIKSVVISKDPIRCKLVVNDGIIKQVMTFNYLGVEVSANLDKTREVRYQTNKANWVYGRVREIIWNNKSDNIQNTDIKEEECHVQDIVKWTEGEEELGMITERMKPERTTKGTLDRKPTAWRLN